MQLPEQAIATIMFDFDSYFDSVASRESVYLTSAKSEANYQALVITRNVG